MTLTDALRDWKQLATTASELSELQEQFFEMQSGYENALSQFEEDLDELEEEERESILSIMSVYEDRASGAFIAKRPNRESPADGTAMRWLINKIGNEGSEGLAWANIVEAWREQHDETPVNELYALLAQNSHLFAKKGLGKRAVVKLTQEGHAQFLNGS